MTDKTLYRKVGRRYIPVAEEFVFDSFREGCHLVVCKPGLKTTVYNINPDYATLLAAFDACRDKMAEAIVEHRDAHRPNH